MQWTFLVNISIYMSVDELRKEERMRKSDNFACLLMYEVWIVFVIWTGFYTICDMNYVSICIDNVTIVTLYLKEACCNMMYFLNIMRLVAREWGMEFALWPCLFSSSVQLRFCSSTVFFISFCFAFLRFMAFLTISAFLLKNEKQLKNMQKRQKNTVDEQTLRLYLISWLWGHFWQKLGRIPFWVDN